MSDTNQHVTNYLQYYCDLKMPPHFVVMVRGDWGSGKTYVVRRFLDSRRPPGEKSIYLYCSLYGLSHTKQIEETFFEQLHPLLASKGAKLVGRIAKAAVSATLRFDITGDAAPDVNLNASLPNGNMLVELQKYDGNILVFDDLERSLLPVQEVLGYINKFVEHGDFKVIIIANEKEIEDPNEEAKSQKQYERIREKLVGATLEVHPETDSALKHFISQVENQQVRKFMNANAIEIAETYEETKLNNLRILQQSIWDFERLFNEVPKRFQKNIAGTLQLFRRFLAMSAEHKAGKLTEENISKLHSARFEGILNKDKPKSITAVFIEKYKTIELRDTILDPSQWADILIRGKIDSKSIAANLSQNQYFVTRKDEAAWRTVWHALERNDNEFNSALEKLQEQITARSFQIPEEVLHVFSLLLWLSNIGIVNKTRAEIVDEYKVYIDQLLNEGKLIDTINSPLEDFSSMNGWGGLGFHEVGTPEFRDMTSHLSNRREEATKKRLPTLCEDLLKLMSNDPVAYLDQLCITGRNDGRYARIPILASIVPQLFVEKILALPPNFMKTAFMTFKIRYEHGTLSNDLKDESSWIEQVKLVIAEQSKGLSTIGQWRINRLIEWYLTDGKVDAS